MKKSAYNPVRNKGFDTKAQMRYLLMMMQMYPEKYSWVKQVLKSHGVPATEGPLHTYWGPPYNISPATPSYVYTGGKGKKKKKAEIINRLEIFGALLNPTLAEKVDEVIEVLRKESPKTVANKFWALWGNDMRKTKDPEELHEWMMRFHRFMDRFKLSGQEIVQAQQYLGDRILGRHVE